MDTDELTNVKNVLRAAAVAGLAEDGSKYQDTDMAKAVKKWRETIGPQLAEENEKPEFNIRDTINEIDSHLQDNDGEHCWSDLIGGRDRYQHCRIFTSMLQMANEGKLVIVQPPDADQGRVGKF